IDLGNEPSRGAKKILLCCRFDSDVKSCPLKITVNGKSLSGGQSNAKWSQWIDFELTADQLQNGINDVAFQAIDGKTKLLDFAISFSY
ncbi:MAG: hypothetical protein Q4G59_01425, partial [Planctomycetia bacterium]|nr:hypothetical protein [Planctomycetia bacterium]